MIDQGELLNRQNPDELTQRLQNELEFKLDEAGEWLNSDDFHNVGGVEKSEVLPSRTRVSVDGARFELGCRIEDLQGLLALTRLNNPAAKDMEAVRDFWPKSTRFVTTEEDGYIYIGSEIEPTPEGLEKGYYGLWLSYEIALEAAQRGLSYEEMFADERRGNTMRQILETRTDGRSGIFDIDEIDGHEVVDDEEWDIGISADNLREFPLVTNETSWNVPGNLVVEGQELEDDRIWLIGHNGGEKVDLHFSQSNYDQEKRGWDYKRYLLELPIPEGSEVRTVNDLATLNKARILTDSTNNVSVEVDVKVTVEDNSVVIESVDGTFRMEVRTPVCEDCHKPEWKFRWPTADEFAEQELSMRKETDISLRSVSYGGQHGFRAYLKDTDGTMHEYCIDHITDAEWRYVKEHPFASRSKALELARKTLDELGYGDVEVDSHLMDRALGNENGWWVYPTIKYERGGKEITRYIVGDQYRGMTISDDGVVQTMLPSREYVEFRS